MTALILKHPAKAAEEVCHEEQLVIWSSDLVGALSMGGYLRDDLDYDQGLEIHRLVQREIKSIVAMAFTHPEAMKPAKG